MTNDPREAFVQEVDELLEAMESALLSLEETPEDPELLHTLFRAMHTIKGTAGVFGFDPIVDFTHRVEGVVDGLRSGERALDEPLIAILLSCRDHTLALVQAVLEGEDPSQVSADLLGRGQQLLDRLCPEPVGDLTAPVASAPDGYGAAKVEKLAGREAADDYWIISLGFGPDALRNGMDPLSFLRYLGSLGEIVDIATRTDRLPPLADFDPESCYLSFQIGFQSDADKATIEGVFQFAEDDCEIDILPPRSKIEEYLALLDDLPEAQVQRLGEILVKIGALTEKEVAQALAAQAADQASARPLGEILVGRHDIQRSIVEQALDKQEKSKSRVAQEGRYIRVDALRLGQLITQVGELVINTAAMRVAVQRRDTDDLQEVVERVEALVGDIRDNALQLRMVQIGETFSRFRRVVRDVSKELGKEIDLVVTGGETELDKTVVEKLNDPLTHLVRNAMDHGIETPQERLACGKPAKGTLQLNAYHDSGRILVEIRDDGAGLDPQRIRAKAEARGLVEPERNLTPQETFRLIFEPGLSTKDEASSLSGRGVGMDVVRRNIEALRGSIELDSQPGQGTKVSISLPLTLAIIDGFLVGAGGEQYVIPLAQVAECVEIGREQALTHGDRHHVNLRGEVLPYLRLKEFFGIRSGAARKLRESLVVVRVGHAKVGLIVDELHGELQTVIKPLGRVFENLKGVAGATVLGTGDIALILDVQQLTALLQAHPQPQAVSGRH
ncbi:chemotaxis protein CheA [Thiorhodococcus minor]|uniref:Chemotaxis protein CheA n=1 Tax=Thiorhodococcus minor TaxID=57489 RepID=A0A6M0K518_9GAMM|nr:chemotaxis protein CheA [Thiorhodococcus minor]NEV64876.1 chemotaxis protein CheA [Thiorhodococcus minor]